MHLVDEQRNGHKRPRERSVGVTITATILLVLIIAVGLPVLLWVLGYAVAFIAAGFQAGCSALGCG